MQLYDQSGIMVEITIAGYQFTLAYLEQRGGKDRTYDPNWLNIRISIKTTEVAWSGESACTLVWDMENLASYIEAMLGEQATFSSCDWIPLDGDFSFGDTKIQGDKVSLQLILKYQYARPGEKVSIIPLMLQRKDLALALTELRQELANYPLRGEPASPNKKT